jgi:thiol-disulfide isomerase/thioredoxin
MRRSLGVALWLAALSACRPAPPRDLTILFFGHSPATSLAGRSWVVIPDSSRLVAFDGALRVARVVTNPRLNTPIAVAAFDGDLLVTEITGAAVVLDTAGALVREWEGPFSSSLYAADGRRVLASRTPYFVQPLAQESSGAPLVWALDSLGRPLMGGALGPLHQPGTPFLIGPTNAGALAADSAGGFYFAPLARDEITRYDAAGKPRWSATRGLRAHETDPLFLPARGDRLPLALAVVNVALARGPGGRLYVLGSEDSTATRLRVDVLDSATGKILETRKLGARETAVAVDARGALVLLDGDSLLADAASAGAGREPFAPAFALLDLRGDTVRSAGLVGKVTLVNFWASWCDPCREEFPHMARLYGEFPRAAFDIVAISDDVNDAKMRAFVRQFRPPFPILVGAGRMKETYHYRGLPYSLLLDRRGRVVRRIFGFGGAEEFQRLHDAIAEEIRAP